MRYARRGAQFRRIVVVGICGVGAWGCNRRVLREFLDLAPQSTVPAPTPAAPVDTAKTVTVMKREPDVVALPALPIEKIFDPDSAMALLPRDHAGNIDWVAALKQGVIRPRPVLPGHEVPDTSFRFKFDFYFPGPDTTFDASFPHSTHTQIIDCQQCHSRIFRYRGAPIKMADIFVGKYCAECHGKVSFPVMTDCERCHTRLALPANRAKPELLGTVTLARYFAKDSVAGKPPADSALRADTAAKTRADSASARDSTKGGGTDSTAVRGVSTNSLPAARFPHWVHRIRYQCKTCHMALFEPKAGANRITMKDIEDGRACGSCHDGKTAFKAGFGACERCHVQPTPVAAAASATPRTGGDTARSPH